MKAHAPRGNTRDKTRDAATSGPRLRGIALAPPRSGIAFVDRAPQAIQRAIAPPRVTSLPEGLRAGIASLSGLDLADVRVHHNSPEPARVGALAFTRDRDIHLASSQERHLPHEAWHVVQQARGRVAPTTSVAGQPVNDDARLEREADVMGARVARATAPTRTSGGPGHTDSGARGPLQGVMQRAVGMEFECSNLEIKDAPADAKKGDKLGTSPPDHADMTYEETSEGTPVVEFVVEPAAETREELINAVTTMVSWTRYVDHDDRDTDVNGYTVHKAGNIEGAIQVTMGTPLEKLPALYAEYRSQLSSAPSFAFGRYQALLAGQDVEREVAEPKSLKVFGIKKLTISWTKTTTLTERVYEAAPDGTEVRALSDPLKGFLLLLMDYIVLGYVPAYARGEAKIPFAKGLYPLMARTDFSSMFKALPADDIDRISEVDAITHQRDMKEAWWKWIIRKSLSGILTPDFLNNDQLINYRLQNVDYPTLADHGGDPKRSDFLRRLPEEDLLVQEGYLGLGKLGNKADVSHADPTRFAPIFELRKPYGSSAAYGTWEDKADETWDKYLAIVGERMDRGGLIV